MKSRLKCRWMSAFYLHFCFFNLFFFLGLLLLQVTVIRHLRLKGFSVEGDSFVLCSLRLDPDTNLREKVRNCIAKQRTAL